MRSTLALPNDYVVVDLETTGTNSAQDDIIEIAAIKYRDGEEVGRFSQLVATDKPLSGFIISLTGITSEMLAGQPPIQEVIQDFSAFVGDDMLVGHNIASFDSCFIAEAYAKYLNRELTNPCVDTLRIHKKLCPEWPRHSLEYLAFSYGISYEGAHRSTVDCEITNACYRCMRDEILANATEAEFCDRPAKPKKKITDIVPTVSSFDPDNPLFQKTVVFTGGLAISRQDAMQLAVNAGAIPRGSVTAKTDYLVVGGQDVSRVGDDGMSFKEEKAHALNASGKAQIQIVSEKDFFALAMNKAATTREQVHFDAAMPDEQKAFELVYPELKDLICNAPKDSGILVFQELGNCSSVYFLDSNELFFRVRLRKKSRYIVISDRYEDLLPPGTETSRTKSNEGMVRIPIDSYEEILDYVPVLRAILTRICRMHRDFGCCGRYEECSDLGSCVHPDPKFSLRCWYHQNLLDGKIFYGENRTV